jgi:hypothetical protein
MAKKTEDFVVAAADVRKFTKNDSDGRLDIEATLSNFAEYLNEYKRNIDELNDRIKPIIVEVLNKVSGNERKTIDTQTLAVHVSQKLAGDDFTKVADYKSAVITFIEQNSCQPNKFDPFNPKLICSKPGRGGGLSPFAYAQGNVTDSSEDSSNKIEV